MILTCPSCSASYMVSSDAIGERGRDVRCKKCGHVWFQKSERDSLDDLITRIQSNPHDEDDISFGDSGVNASVKVAEKSSIVDRIKLFFASKFKKKEKVSGKSAPIAAPKNVVFAQKTVSKSRYVAGFMVALALVSVLVFGLVSQRWAVVKFVPSLSAVFVGAGFPLSPYADVNPEEALILEKVELSSDIDGKKIRGNMINLTSDLVRIPALKVVYLDHQGGVVKEDRYMLQQSGLPKEANIAFALPVAAQIPHGAVAVEVRFSE